MSAPAARACRLGPCAGWRLGPINQPPRALLLHGFTGSSADWWPCWPAMVPAVAIDLPGHGDSPAPPGCASDWLAAMLQALPPSSDELIGYSLGGRLALALLRAAPGRFRRVTLIAAHPGLTSAAARARRRAADAGWTRQLRERGIDAFVRAWERQPLFASQQRVAPERLAAQRARRLAQSAEGLARALECFGLGAMPSTWRALGAHAGRLCWIVGAEDAQFRALAERACLLRPDTDYRLLANCGHNPLLEAPAELGALLRPAAGTARP